MAAQTYKLVKSNRKTAINFSASALVYEIIVQLISTKKYNCMDLCLLFDLNVVSANEVVDMQQIENSSGIFATSDECPAIVHEESMPLSRNNMYFSKPLYIEKTAENIYVSHQWSKWLNEDGSKRERGYLFLCIESFISICSKLGFEIITNPID